LGKYAYALGDIVGALSNKEYLEEKERYEEVKDAEKEVERILEGFFKLVVTSLSVVRREQLLQELSRLETEKARIATELERLKALED
jgi:pyridoxal/pyridoxine/pyridoxamine kinase